MSQNFYSKSNKNKQKSSSGPGGGREQQQTKTKTNLVGDGKSDTENNSILFDYHENDKTELTFSHF